MPTPGTPRFAWVDSVRGTCILAVVLLHFSLAGFYPYVWNTTTADAWVFVNGVLTAVRMPTLFAISGFLLSSRIRAGWRDPRTRFSALHAYYLYVIWLFIYALVSPWFATGARPLTDAAGWTSLLEQLVNPHTMLWFVLGLAFWSAVLATMHRLPAWVVLTTLLVVTFLSFTIEWTSSLDFYIRILRYGFYFGIGIYLRPVMERLINDRVWLTSLVSLAVFLALRFLGPLQQSFDLPFNVVAPLRDLAAVGVAMGIIAVVTKHVTPLRRALTWIGSRTLPIYVLHSLVIWMLVKIPGWGFGMSLPIHRYVAPALWTVIVALICIGLYNLAMFTPLRLLFDMPQRWRARLRKENSAAR